MNIQNTKKLCIVIITETDRIFDFFYKFIPFSELIQVGDLQKEGMNYLFIYFRFTIELDSGEIEED